jgi:16S rRNA (uracil1498-N3)-methyltransferase
MPFDRFYVETSLFSSSQTVLEKTELHHLAHVMRIRVGETIELIDGKGTLAKATVASLDKKKALLTIEEIISQEPATTPKILLGIPLLRPSKLEWILEKGTELGVDAFLIYPADFSDKKTLSQSVLERLQMLMISAIKQSGRLFLPSLSLLSHFSHLFTTEATILYGDTRNSAKKINTFPFPILFITGPESGFSQEEYALLEKKGTGIQLNEHTLRAETAPLTAASLLAWHKLYL